MATGSISTSTSISDIEGYLMKGKFCYGDNGDSPSAFERYLGSSNLTTLQKGSMIWGEDPDDYGLDTDELNFSFTVPASGGTGAPSLLYLEKSAAPDTLEYGGSTYGTIQSVQIRAAVMTNAAVSYSSLSVAYYKAGRKTEVYTPSAANTPTVDTRTVGAIAQSLLTVTPALTTNDHVLILGNIHFQFNVGVYPDVNGLFADMFIFN